MDDLLEQREAAMAAFDEKLAKLGYHANSGNGTEGLSGQGSFLELQAKFFQAALGLG